MGKKRTRQEKMVAALRRQVENKPEVLTVLEKKPVIQNDFYQPEVTLPEVGLKQDLTRTGIVTILALVLQIGLYVYLNRGGWQIISKLIERR